jgi:hypothetical protein
MRVYRENLSPPASPIRTASSLVIRSAARRRRRRRPRHVNPNSCQRARGAPIVSMFLLSFSRRQEDIVYQVPSNLVLRLNINQYTMTPLTVAMPLENHFVMNNSDIFFSTFVRWTLLPIRPK